MSWRRFLDGDLHEQAVVAIDDIVEAAAGNSGEGAFHDVAGRACLLAYAGRARDHEALLGRAGELLEAAVAGLPEGCSGAGLWGGLADARFSLAHFVAEDDADHALRAIDDTLIASLDAIRDRVDLIGGLAGIGVAALEELGQGSGAALAVGVLDVFERTARHEESGVGWFTPPEVLPQWQRERCPGGYWNLGLAHGIPGVIGFLAAMVAAEVESIRARALLEGAVSWLLAAAPSRTPARYPSWLTSGGQEQPTRTAWCYGDAGVAIALFAAGRALNDGVVQAEASMIAKAAAKRSLQDSGIRDAGICHGAAGVAHIFNRLHQATGDEELGEAARRWYERLVAMRRTSEAVAGFPALNRVGGADVWIADHSVLTGATGVGLALLAATSEIEPSWDRALLCGVRPRETA